MASLRQLMDEINNRWPGNSLPTSYLVIDIETSGFPGSKNPNDTEACVVQFGYAAVRDKELVQREAHYLKHPPGTMQPDAERLTGITDEMLATGEEPHKFYTKMAKLYKLYADNKLPIVGHNLINFDVPFIGADMNRFDIPQLFDKNLLVDTGMLYKASRLGMAPCEDETLLQFFQRVGETRSRVKWNLSHAIQRLQIDKKYDLDLTAAHDAGYDCYMTHLLLEELRLLAERTPSASS